MQGVVADARRHVPQRAQNEQGRTCESHGPGRRGWRHAVAAFVMASSGPRGSPKRWFTRFGLPGGGAGIADPPTWLGARAARRRGCRRPKRAAPAERCSCRGCGRRFADRPGFEGLHYTEDAALFALRPLAMGASPGRAAVAVLEEKGVDPSGRTMQRWADKCPKPVSAFSKCLGMWGRQRGERRRGALRFPPVPHGAGRRCIMPSRKKPRRRRRANTSPVGRPAAGPAIAPATAPAPMRRMVPDRSVDAAGSGTTADPPPHSVMTTGGKSTFLAERLA